MLLRRQEILREFSRSNTNSFQVGNIASDGIGMIWDRPIAVKCVANRVLKLVRCGHRARSPEILVPVIDSAVIFELAGRIKHRAFRSGGRARALYQFSMNVAQRGYHQVELFVVRANASGCFAGVRINQPKVRFAMKFFMQFLNGGRVTVRNGAIGSNKKQHDDSSVGRLEWIDSFAVEIFRPYALPRLRNAKRRAKSTTQKRNANNPEHRYLQEVHGGGNSPPGSSKPQFYTFRLLQSSSTMTYITEHIRKSMPGYRASTSQCCGNLVWVTCIFVGK